MTNLEVGQVSILRIRFHNAGDIAKSRYPYLIVGINEVFCYVEIVQLGSLEGKKHKAAFKSNKVIFCTDPDETVIDKTVIFKWIIPFILNFFVDCFHCAVKKLN